MTALPQDPSEQAICFFDAFYVRGPRELGTNIWAEQIIPRLSKSSPDSIISLSTTAVAMQMLDKERRGIMRSSAALKFYLQAVAVMRTLLVSGLEAHYDEILCGIFMLEIFENLSNLAGESEHTAVHQNAGMRTIRRGLSLSLEAANTTNTIASALQSRYIWSCFATGAPCPLFAIENCSYLGPTGELDSYAARAADILHERNLLLAGTANTPWNPRADLNTPPTVRDTVTDSTAALSALLFRTITLLTDLQAYYSRLPLSWRPQRISTTSPEFHPSIRTAGLYSSLCDVYSSLPTSHANCMFRVVRIAALQTRWLLEQRLLTLAAASTSKVNEDTYDTETDALMGGSDCRPEIQSMVDDICAAVPFHLGNRLPKSSSTTASANTSRRGPSASNASSNVSPNPFATFFPPASPRLRNLARFFDENNQPTTMTDATHAAEAAAKGGFMIIVPLGLLVGLFYSGSVLLPDTSQRPNPITLRDGQLEWMLSQLARATAIQLRPSSG